ncbi:hypothetical protein [Oricola nitratireducens]|uniref:hypothetical protein n=1 Tax=Oricola nitratireducens TaxID=2775868 RepID=UPI00186929F6|nr:hypothetical protein [Oricola nitratireducens]
MNKKALDKAASRLRVAEKALSELTVTDDFRAFTDNWYVFLTSAKNVYTSLEQGAKSNPKSRQWFGAKKAERKSDALLQYLFQARDDEEHGLETSIAYVPERHEIGVTKDGYSNEMNIELGPSFNIIVKNATKAAATFEGAPPPPGAKVTPLDNKPVLTKRTPSEIALKSVTGRGNITYQPPREHLGKPLSDTSPIAVAKLGLCYLHDLLKEASALA